MNFVKYKAVTCFYAFWKPYLDDVLYLIRFSNSSSVICLLSIPWEHENVDSEPLISKKMDFVKSLFCDRDVIRFSKFWSQNNQARQWVHTSLQYFESNVSKYAKTSRNGVPNIGGYEVTKS